MASSAPPSTTDNRATTAPLWIFVGTSVVALVLVVRYVLASGTWLDEYWQLWISGAPAGALADRLMNDTHPPWFNLLGRSILGLTGSEVVPARLVNLLLASAALGGGLFKLRGLPADLRWRLFLLIVASGGTVGLAALGASFRVYAWLLVLAGLQGAVLLAVLLDRPVPALLAALVTTASVGLHYGHAIGAIALALVTITFSWRHNRRIALAIAAGLTVGVMVDVGLALAQLPHWRVNANVDWVAKTPGAASSAFAAVLTDHLMFNLVAVALLVLAVVRGGARTAAWLLAPLALAVAAWLLLSPVMPIVPRYLPSVTAMLCVAAAYGWHQLRFRPAIDGVVAAAIAFQPLVFSLARPPLAGWEAGARAAAAITRQCPGAQLYAIPAGRFGNDPDSALSRFETPVMGLAYRNIGHKFGLRPQLVTVPARVRESHCPAIVWMEAAHGIEQAPPETVLRRAQLTPPAEASFRFIPTPNGALLLIVPADRLQQRR